MEGRDAPSPPRPKHLHFTCNVLRPHTAEYWKRRAPFILASPRLPSPLLPSSPAFLTHRNVHCCWLQQVSALHAAKSPPTSFWNVSRRSQTTSRHHPSRCVSPLRATFSRTDSTKTTNRRARQEAARLLNHRAVAPSRKQQWRPRTSSSWPRQTRHCLRQAPRYTTSPLPPPSGAPPTLSSTTTLCATRSPRRAKRSLRSLTARMSSPSISRPPSPS